MAILITCVIVGAVWAAWDKWSYGDPIIGAGIFGAFIGMIVGVVLTVVVMLVIQLEPTIEQHDTPLVSINDGAGAETDGGYLIMKMGMAYYEFIYYVRAEDGSYTQTSTYVDQSRVVEQDESELEQPFVREVKYYTAKSIWTLFGGTNYKTEYVFYIYPGSVIHEFELPYYNLSTE